MSAHTPTPQSALKLNEQHAWRAVFDALSAIDHAHRECVYAGFGDLLLSELDVARNSASVVLRQIES